MLHGHLTPVGDEVSEGSTRKKSNVDFILGGFHKWRPQNVRIFLPPCHCHKSADFVPVVCFLGTPLPPPAADVLYGSPLCMLLIICAGGGVSCRPSSLSYANARNHFSSRHNQRSDRRARTAQARIASRKVEQLSLNLERSELHFFCHENGD